MTGRNAAESVPYRARSAIVVNDLEDAAAPLITLLFLIVVAFADIGPVGDIDATVGAVFGVHATKPWVLRKAKISAVVGDVAAAVRLKDVAIEALAVDVEHERIAAIFGRPVIAQ